MTRRLRMPYLRAAATDVVPTARAQRWDPAELLRVLLSEEITGRDQATLRNRRRQPNFPAGKTLQVWDEARCSIPAATQQALRSLEWIDRRENALHPSAALPPVPRRSTRTRSRRFESGRQSSTRPARSSVVG